MKLRMIVCYIAFWLRKKWRHSSCKWTFIKTSDDQQQGILQYLLGLQYQYLSDTKQANYYLNKAKKNLKGTPYHKKVKESMV